MDAPLWRRSAASDSHARVHRLQLAADGVLELLPVVEPARPLSWITSGLVGDARHGPVVIESSRSW